MRYPFMAVVNKFMNCYAGVYSEGMFVELTRRYPKISKQLDYLYSKKLISTTDPQYITPEDIKEYIIYLKKTRKIKDTSVSHELSALSNLCIFINSNNCVEAAKIKYPLLFKKQRHILLSVLEMPEYDRLIATSEQLTIDSDPIRVRAFTAAVLCVCAGLRTQELQHSKWCNLDRDCRYIYLDHVKGMGTYGVARTVPIRPEALHILQTYSQRRSKNSTFLFENAKGSPLSGNALRVDLSRVRKELGIELDYRKCRRTYAQFLIDENLPLEQVSVVLGHSSTKTTERNYARPRADRVVRHVIDTWNNNKKE